MSVISFKSENENTTKVNNDFIQNEMPKMSGDYVKIYLYMLMLSSNGKDVDIENIADKFGIFTSEVLKILEALDERNLVHFAKIGDGFELSFDNIKKTSTPLTVKKEDAQIEMPKIKIDEALVTAYSSNVAAPKEETRTRETYSQEELAFIYDSNKDINDVKDYIESKYGVLFTFQDLQNLVNILEGENISCEVVMDIIDYLHLNETKIVKLPMLLRAIENKAIDIKEKGLTNEDDIRDYLTNSDPIYKKVLKSYGIIGRDITSAEKAYVDRWTITYHMPIEVINYAIDKTILATSQPSFQYTESILLNWNTQNLHSLPEVQGVKNIIKSPKVNSTSAQTNKFNNYSKTNEINDQEIDNMTKLFDRFN